MTDTTMSFRMEKLRSENFIKNFNHSNRNEHNSDHIQLGKNIDKSRIKDNVFLINNTIIDNCKNIDEVWKIFEEDYQRNSNDYKIKKINKKVKFTKSDLQNKEILKKYNISSKTASKFIKKIDKDNLEYTFVKQGRNFITEIQESKCKAPFIRKSQNKRKNINGTMVSETVETSLINEFIFQIGGSENDIRDKLSKTDFINAYKFALEEIHKTTKGTILKAVIHFDESYPHMHLFFTPYNIEKKKVENEFTSRANNISKLQNQLFVKVREYLIKNHNLKLKPLKRKDNHDIHHQTIKEFKEVHNTKKIQDKDFIDIQRKEDLKLISSNKAHIPTMAKPFIDTDKYILLNKSQFIKDFKSIQEKYIFTSNISQKEDKLKRQNNKLLLENDTLKKENELLQDTKKEFLELSLNNVPKKSFEEVQSKYDTLSNEQKNLKNETVSLFSFQSLKSKYTALKSKLSDYEQKLKDYTKILKENIYLKSENQKLKSKIETQEDTLQNLYHKNSSFQNNISNLKFQYQKLKKEYDLTVTKNSETVSLLTSENEKLSNDIKEKIKENSELKSMKEKLIYEIRKYVENFDIDSSILQKSNILSI